MMDERKWNKAWVEYLSGRTEKVCVSYVHFDSVPTWDGSCITISADVLRPFDGILVEATVDVRRISSTPWGLWWLIHESNGEHIIAPQLRDC